MPRYLWRWWRGKGKEASGITLWWVLCSLPPLFFSLSLCLKASIIVSLPIFQGHIFHKECSDSWLKSCRMRNDPACCPLCKIPLGSNRALSLYPGDVNDLASYLAHRNRRVAIQQQHPKEGQKIVPATMALDRHMTREAQGQLLGSLMDFRQHINAYIMSVNNVSMSTSGGEDRIFRLFGDFSKTTEETQAEFEVRLHC